MARCNALSKKKRISSFRISVNDGSLRMTFMDRMMDNVIYTQTFRCGRCSSACSRNPTPQPPV